MSANAAEPDEFYKDQNPRDGPGTEVVGDCLQPTSDALNPTSPASNSAILSLSGAIIAST